MVDKRKCLKAIKRCRVNYKVTNFDQVENSFGKIENSSKFGKDQKNFDVYFCIIFEHYCQKFIFKEQAGH